MWSAILSFFTTTLYQPIYNGLVFLIDVIPGGDVGLAVIAITLAVKFILLPLSIKSIRTQQVMKKIKPEIDRIKEEHGEDKEQQAVKMMEAYSEYNVNPFSGLFIILVQFPIIIALYYVFLNGGLPDIDPTLVYSFIELPQSVDMLFFGSSLAEKSFILAVIAGLSQFLQSWISNKLSSNDEVEEAVEKKESTFMDEFKDNISGKFTYILPGVVFVISYTLPSVVAVYWATSNLFQLFQTIYVDKTINNEDVVEELEDEKG